MNFRHFCLYSIECERKRALITQRKERSVINSLKKCCCCFSFPFFSLFYSLLLHFFFSITFIKRGNNSFNIFSIDFPHFPHWHFNWATIFTTTATKTKHAGCQLFVCLCVCIIIIIEPVARWLLHEVSFFQTFRGYQWVFLLGNLGKQKTLCIYVGEKSGSGKLSGKRVDIYSWLVGIQGNLIVVAFILNSDEVFSTVFSMIMNGV